MVAIYGRTGASFITVGFAPPPWSERVRRFPHWRMQSFYPNMAGGEDPNQHYLYWYWLQAPQWVSAGASTSEPDRRLWERWKGLANSYTYVNRVRRDVYGPGGIRIGASSYGGAQQQIDYDLYTSTIEMNRRGLWPYSPPAPVRSLAGDPEKSLYAN